MLSPQALPGSPASIKCPSRIFSGALAAPSWRWRPSPKPLILEARLRACILTGYLWELVRMQFARPLPGRQVTHAHTPVQ